MTTWLFEPTTDEPGARDVLDITMRFEGEVTVCVLGGPLCAYTAPTLHQWLSQLRHNHRHRVIIDVRRLDALSGDGVDVLLHHAERCRAAGGALQVRSPSVVAQRVLALCDAEHLVEGG